MTLTFKSGDQVKGIIYKGDEEVSRIKAGKATKNKEHMTLALEAFEFELATEGSPPLEVNDKCRLVTDAGETDVEVIHVLETQGLTFTTFVFKQPYSTEFSSNC
jgi:hypothetical protein